jgi:acyl carrier protein
LNRAEQIIDFITSNLASTKKLEITVDTDLIGEGVIDSTALMDMILWLEESFKISIDVDDLVPENFGTVRNMVEYIEQNLARSKSGD